MEDAEVDAYAGNYSHLCGWWHFFMRTVEHTFRGFNTAFLACALINGCRCGNVREVRDGTRRKESRNFPAMIFEFHLHVAKEKIESISTSSSGAWAALLVPWWPEHTKGTGCRKWGLAELRVWRDVQCPQSQVRWLLCCLGCHILLSPT